MLMTSSDNTRLDALRKREVALKAAIAAEHIRQQKREEKERARLATLIGTALIDEAEHQPDLALTLRHILKTVQFDERGKKFLEDRGWL